MEFFIDWRKRIRTKFLNSKFIAEIPVQTVLKTGIFSRSPSWKLMRLRHIVEMVPINISVYSDSSESMPTMWTVGNHFSIFWDYEIPLWSKITKNISETEIRR